MRKKKQFLLVPFFIFLLAEVAMAQHHWVSGEDFLYTTYNAKVGINTGDPQYELDVNGTVNAKILKVNGRTIRGKWQNDGNKLFINFSNVGIGTTRATEKLTVAGLIHVSDLEVEPTLTAPDYVFQSSYALPTLEWMSGYIEEHGHLPHFKSAEEMEGEGIDLEATQMALLRTLEEAFLHQIALQERLERLVKERKQLTQEWEELAK